MDARDAPEPRTLDTLAVAQAASGRMDDASATAERALGLATAAGDAELAAQIAARLALFRARRAYVEGPRQEPAGTPEIGSR
jgi:hypothetical protein